MHIFYTPDIKSVKELPEEESQHCIKVLRLSEGTEIMLTDGKGIFYKAIITLAPVSYTHLTLPTTERV